jgi:hypothetical protein
MRTGLIDVTTNPYQGNVLPDNCMILADNGMFAEDGPRTGWIGHKRWYEWLEGIVDRYGPERFRGAVAPDVPFDAVGTLRESTPWLGRIRDLGIPAAFAAQNGCELYGLPWDDLDVLFLAGGPEIPGDPKSEWKIGPVAQELVRQAIRLSKWVHMGRVNSEERLRKARLMGCHSADGTYLRFGPDINLERLLGWLERLGHQPMIPGLSPADWSLSMSGRVFRRLRPAREKAGADGAVIQPTLPLAIEVGGGWIGLGDADDAVMLDAGDPRLPAPTEVVEGV